MTLAKESIQKSMMMNMKRRAKLEIMMKTSEIVFKENLLTKLSKIFRLMIKFLRVKRLE